MRVERGRPLAADALRRLAYFEERQTEASQTPTSSRSVRPWPDMASGWWTWLPAGDETGKSAVVTNRGVRFG